MTTIAFPATDPRGPKAVAIALEAGQWAKCRLVDGSKCYGVPSQRDADHRYLVTRTTCTCKAFAYGKGRACKHVVAVRLFCAYQKELAA